MRRPLFARRLQGRAPPRVKPAGWRPTRAGLLAALALLLGLAATAQAATSIWSNTVGGFPTWYGSPTVSSNAYTLSAPLPTWPPYALGNQQHLRIVIPSSGTNTGAATLNIASTGALPIVTNAESGLAALVGGELVAGLEYDLTYSTSSASACSNSCYVLSWLAAGPVLAGTTQTITASAWVSWSVYPVTAASQTLTLPASSGLSPNGGIVIQTIGQSVTLQASGSDAINGGSAGGSIVLPAGIAAFVTTSGAGAFYAAPTTTGNSGTVTSVGLAAGLTDAAGTCNTGSQAITTSGTAYPQNCPAAYTSAHTVAAADGVQLYVANGSSAVTFTLPQADGGSGARGVGYCFADESGHGYTLATTTSTFYGPAGVSGSTVSLPTNSYACVTSDGTNWVMGVAGGSGTVSSVALAPGLTDVSGTCNAGTQAITQTGTVYPQDCPSAYTGNHTVAASDGVQLYIADGSAAVIFTLPQANGGSGALGAGYCFADESGHGYELTTSTSVFYGPAGVSGSTIGLPANAYACVTSDGTNWAMGVAYPPISDEVAEFKLSNDASAPGSVIDVAAGTATSDDATTQIIEPAITKSLGSTWAAGNGNGCLDTGSVAPLTWYTLYAIANGVAPDLLCSTTTTNSPTLPSGYTKKRRIGAIETSVLSLILGFTEQVPHGGSTRIYPWNNPPMLVTTSLTTTAGAAALANIPPAVISANPIIACAAPLTPTAPLWRPASVLALQQPFQPVPAIASSISTTCNGSLYAQAAPGRLWAAGFGSGIPRLPGGTPQLPPNLLFTFYGWQE